MSQVCGVRAITASKMFTNASNIDARGSNLINLDFIQIPVHEHHQLLHNLCNTPSRALESLSRTKDLSRVYPFEIGSTGDLACGFIHKIKDLLADRAEPINDDHEWNDELESLRQTLILTELARQ